MRFRRDEPPMVCEQKVHPTHPEFARPTWVDLDLESNLQMVYNAEGFLVRFTPSGTTQPRREEWEKTFRERQMSGAAKPRLRMTSVIIGAEPATLVSYEPLVNECLVNLAEQGVGGNSGGYLFSLRSESSELEPMSGAYLRTSPANVLIYRDEYPYITSASPDFEVLEVRGDDGEMTRQLRPVYTIGLHALKSAVDVYPRYWADERCYVRVDRPAIPLSHEAAGETKP
jgi:hypothetical protein